MKHNHCPGEWVIHREAVQMASNGDTDDVLTSTGVVLCTIKEPFDLEKIIVQTVEGIITGYPEDFLHLFTVEQEYDDVDNLDDFYFEEAEASYGKQYMETFDNLQQSLEDFHVEQTKGGTK